jgi:phosphocarrier protein HPr
MAKTESVLIKRKVKITNRLGLHARPAAEFVRAAHAFRSDVWLVKGRKRSSAASIIEVLRANLNCGDTAVIEAEGPDAEKAVGKLVKLVCQFAEKDLEAR